MEELWQMYTDHTILITVIFPTIAVIWGMLSCVLFRNWWFGSAITGIFFSLWYLIGFREGFGFWIFIYIVITLMTHLSLHGLLAFVNRYRD
ncbi:hypothetical protein SAMN04487866_10238 [Thermoactinomyces sp. DSM 45891]|uniref:hypothetical protein n=1 Tax=Thermoactinomyces sp. DSM 45891 TaxID=1761907 RepID=UPI0009108114|nr:hypothetical protein [Thermoactinomyces sp. DSM 45891]SFX18066.1 hypothetical protein SAMN04487866_10238 [Thermoactinomyces sp. DSM 45891]